MCIFLILTAATPACTAWGEQGEQQLMGISPSKTPMKLAKPLHNMPPLQEEWNKAVHKFLLPKQALEEVTLVIYLWLHVKVWSGSSLGGTGGGYGGCESCDLRRTCYWIEGVIPYRQEVLCWLVSTRRVGGVVFSFFNSIWLRPFRPQSTQARHSCTLPVTLAAAEQRSSPSTIYIV